MLRLTWTETGLDDLAWWAEHDPKTLRRVITLCLAVCKDPTHGTGKPEPLRFEFQGYWSRRITDQHRLVYIFDHQEVTIIQCRYHYQK